MLRPALVLAGALACSFPLIAQNPAPPPGRGFGFMAGRGFGGPGGLMRIAARGLGAGVTGAPFSAQAVTTDQRTLSNGDHTDHTQTALIARDSSGRTRIEVTRPAGRGADANGAAQSVIFISDPVAHMAYTVYPARQLAIARKLPAGRGGNHPPRTPHSPNPNRPNAPQAASLGDSTLAGVPVTGTSYTTTIPAGREGNTQPIVIVRQVWVDSALHLTVSESVNDPRRGQSGYTLQNVSTSEPDATLFTVPSGYTASNGRGRRAGRGGPGGAGAPLP